MNDGTDGDSAAAAQAKQDREDLLLKEKREFEAAAVQAKQDRDDLLLKEERQFKAWQNTQDRLKGFDDLLMRLRVFALPFVVSVIGAGSALLAGQPKPEVHFGWLVTVALAGALGIVALLYTIEARLKGVFGLVALRNTIAARLSRKNKPPAKTADPEKSAPSKIESYAWLVMAALIAGWAVVIYFVKPDALSPSGLVLVLGGAVLFLIHIADRYYYHALLLGAVDRAKELEEALGFITKGPWGFRKGGLSLSISDAVKGIGTDLLPVTLYILPAAALINLGLAIITLSD